MAFLMWLLSAIKHNLTFFSWTLFTQFNQVVAQTQKGFCTSRHILWQVASFFQESCRKTRLTAVRETVAYIANDGKTVQLASIHSIKNLSFNLLHIMPSARSSHIARPVSVPNAYKGRAIKISKCHPLCGWWLRYHGYYVTNRKRARVCVCLCILEQKPCRGQTVSWQKQCLKSTSSFFCVCEKHITTISLHVDAYSSVSEVQT